jgi:5-oxoprolinase (ATP-hydrolysing) subunit A
MRKTIALAKKHGVEVGAHPGFPDLVGFGRRNMDATLEEIQDYVIYQMGAIQAVARSQGLKLQHVKAHGGLYNMAAANAQMMEAIAEAVARVDREVIVVVFAPSKRAPFLEVGRRQGIRIAFEAFADRAYTREGSLLSRREKGAVIEDHEVVARRALKMAVEGKVLAVDGTEIELKADTLCVHGDNPAAVHLVKKIRETLNAAGVEVTAMKNFL